MSIQISTAQDKGYALLKISGDMTIYHSVEIKEKIMEDLYGNNTLVMDLSGVLDMDTAGYQLLILAKKESVKQNKSMKLINHSSAVLKMLDLYGGVGFFGDKIKIPKDEKSNYIFSYGLKKQKIPV